MTDTAHVASFRRVTPGVIASARLAMANDVPDVTKSEIALLLKRAAPILGIDGSTYHVMDILLGLSRAEDWSGSGRPVVAISNAKLAEYTMRSERTVIRCIRRLVEVGIAAYRDSSTGRRFVYRRDNGEVISGFGIDFTPARVRVAEIKVAVQQYHMRLKEELADKRDVARLSRALEDMCSACPKDTTTVRSELEAILTGQDPLRTRADKLRNLHMRTIETLAADAEFQNLTCEGDIDVTPNINTIPESNSEGRNQRTRSNERENQTTDSGKAAELAFEKKPPETLSNPQASKAIKPDRDADILQTEILASVSIGLLQIACREAQSMTGVALDSWSALARAGETFRRMVGLSEAAWNEGRAKVGVYAATAILATVLEKSIRDPEQISKPGGYFRAMIDRAMDGRLNLERSLFGLAGPGY